MYTLYRALVLFIILKAIQMVLRLEARLLRPLGSVARAPPFLGEEVRGSIPREAIILFTCVSCKWTRAFQSPNYFLMGSGIEKLQTFEMTCVAKGLFQVDFILPFVLTASSS